MTDGLYQVTTSRLCAGCVIEWGRIRRSMCAPILRNKLRYWMTVARRVDEKHLAERNDGGIDGPHW